LNTGISAGKKPDKQMTFYKVLDSFPIAESCILQEKVTQGIE
jgi:hypothetical protein